MDGRPSRLPVRSSRFRDSWSAMHGVERHDRRDTHARGRARGARCECQPRRIRSGRDTQGCVRGMNREALYVRSALPIVLHRLPLSRILCTALIIEAAAVS